MKIVKSLLSLSAVLCTLYNVNVTAAEYTSVCFGCDTNQARSEAGKLGKNTGDIVNVYDLKGGLYSYLIDVENTEGFMFKAVVRTGSKQNAITAHNEAKAVLDAKVYDGFSIYTRANKGTITKTIEIPTSLSSRSTNSAADILTNYYSREAFKDYIESLNLSDYSQPLSYTAKRALLKTTIKVKARFDDGSSMDVVVGWFDSLVEPFVIEESALKPDGTPYNISISTGGASSGNVTKYYSSKGQTIKGTCGAVAIRDPWGGVQYYTKNCVYEIQP